MNIRHRCCLSSSGINNNYFTFRISRNFLKNLPGLRNAGRRLIYDLSDHTDINSATTTTLINPTELFTIRARTISVEVAGACEIQLQWTNADGSGGDHIFRDLRFTSAGTYVVDLGDIGQHNPNGANGLLEAITNNAIVIDIDIMYRED